jgi:hypothetical protein
MLLKRFLFILPLIFCLTISWAQNLDKVYDSSIHTVLIHPLGNPLGIPVINLGEQNPLTISFDDFTNQYQEYYYSVELLDKNGRSVAMDPSDYVMGFNQQKITGYKASSVAAQSYFHYQFNYPNENARLKVSGNFILSVYKNANKTNLVFIKRFFVVESLVNVLANVDEPFDGNISKTHQHLKLKLDISKVPYFQTDQLQIAVWQNYLFNHAQILNSPNFIRGDILEYNNEEQLIFPAGKEARWLDLQSLRLRSDRIEAIESHHNYTKVIVKPDVSRASMAYYNFNDLNGAFVISNSESLEAEVQNDYAFVVFSYVPPERIPFVGQKLYLLSSFTNNDLGKEAEMVFDPKLGYYQKTILLKQGYYSYNYVLRDKELPNYKDDFTETEGNHWETENNYTVMVYYRAPGTRYDQIIGFLTLNSKQNW